MYFFKNCFEVKKALGIVILSRLCQISCFSFVTVLFLSHQTTQTEDQATTCIDDRRSKKNMKSEISSKKYEIGQNILYTMLVWQNYKSYRQESIEETGFL